MAVKIPFGLLQNLQQMEVVVSGPKRANRMFIVAGQFDTVLSSTSALSVSASANEIFSVLLGPKLTKKQFVRAIGTASLAKTQSTGGRPTWNILNVDADWDDASGQVELTIEAQVISAGARKTTSINGFAFYVTILAALPAS
jgi:hypothetical protein